MMLALRVTKPPDLVVVTNSANFTIPGEVNVYVINEKNTTVLAFVLGVVSDTLMLCIHSSSIGKATTN